MDRWFDLGDRAGHDVQRGDDADRAGLPAALRGIQPTRPLGSSQW
jgi:hypothetical protein